jgi:excisionase family DNA binding protein
VETIRSATKPSTVHLDGPLLRPDEAARLLAVKTNWIYEAVRDGRLPCLRLGRHIRFTRLMLEQWLVESAEPRLW